MEIPHSDDSQPPNLGDTEEEPRLKYQRLGCDVAELLGNNAATCLCVSDKILALGTHNGTVHVLDYIGNEVCREAINSLPISILPAKMLIVGFCFSFAWLMTWDLTCSCSGLYSR